MPFHTDSFGGLSDGAVELLAKLEMFRHLPENWDGNNAAKPSVQAIDRAAELVRDIDRAGACPDMVAPGPNGEIVVALTRGERAVELYCDAHGDAEYCVFDGDECIIESDTVPEASEVIAALR
jgi:hypothetical protein